ncbi:MAG: hypothetical protein KF729_26735 [Sandaracinaceae bacterium]|nr:hypothetical protein [Sandaracinaceae bacterium]
MAKGEIGLFHALKRSLVALAQPPAVLVEVYHGPKYQVCFTGTATYLRAAPRCELSDLAVIVYDRRSGDARLTYIQAKSERTVAASQRGVANQRLSANLAQWHLLAMRPVIRGATTSFSPPQDLLSSARLESIGAFAFFLHGPSGVDIYYAAASRLALAGPYTSRSGRVVAAPEICRCQPVPECLSVYGNAEFGAFLLGLMIGTPILRQRRPQMAVSGWLAAQLRGLAKGVPSQGAIAREIAELLDPDGPETASQPSLGATSVVIFGLDGTP